MVDRLDEVVDTVLTSAGSTGVPADPELASLWRLVVDLVDLPSEGFRTRLGADLAGSGAQTRQASPAIAFVRPGFHSLTPYLLAPGAARLIEFMRQAFGAEEVFRAKLPDGSIMHAEVRIGDSLIELSDGGGPWQPRPAAIHLYVEDADATYARALRAGATSLIAPTDMPYGDREGDVKDPLGNHWYIGTYKLDGPIWPGLRSVTPALHAKGADRLIDFLKQALGAEELERDHAPDGPSRTPSSSWGIRSWSWARHTISSPRCRLRSTTTWRTRTPSTRARCARALRRSGSRRTGPTAIAPRRSRILSATIGTSRPTSAAAPPGGTTREGGT